jgi:hypothetical protein
MGQTLKNVLDSSDNLDSVIKDLVPDELVLIDLNKEKKNNREITNDEEDDASDIIVSELGSNVDSSDCDLDGY